MKRTFKYLLGICLLIVLAACGENAPDCLQSTGDSVEITVSVPAFDRIIVFERIRLVLAQGPVPEVRIRTGENLLPEVEARVVDGVLELRDHNNCNLFRDYGQTTVFVTVPELTEIRSSTGLTIESSSPLAFANLRLISESFTNPETATTDGLFDLEFSGGRIRVVSNGIAYFKLRGTAALLDVLVAAGDSRVEAAGLQADEVRVSHRGSNALEVYPVNRIQGQIRGYGDVRSFNRPPEVEVTALYRGRLIFITD